ncbi:hypothetical protein N7457_001362 [Penicillium paradoxum]|uniref:uncharacterized protein n=1 Tax=Penicillium paradoxum TaxID=176176 RepID=UPI0025478D51|nr:uncharacterized protein N7457_001362 [Penicillium paradoxum]KAJ5794763.1 hypothetical protein N7457_001362 [Penicillium paradoxum]
MSSLVDNNPTTLQRPSIAISLYSYGHSNGPFVRSEEQEQDSIMLSYNIRHLPNPPRNLRAMTTGLSPRLRKEFLKNDTVETFLERTQNEIISSLGTCCDALSQEDHTSHCKEQDASPPESVDLGTHQNPDISLLVTVCCEEGRHRSVAFVEELARRLALLRGGDDLSRPWKLSITTSHRDLEVLGSGSDLTAGSQGGKSRTKNRQRGGGKDARRLNQKNRNGHDEDVV